MDRFISTADFHLREDVPRCRVETQEEWVQHQLGRLQWVIDKAIELNARFIIVSGDLFHRPRCPEWFLNRVIAVMRQSKVLWVLEPGNHDMDKRDPDMSKTSYGILDQMAQMKQDPSVFVRARDFLAVVPYNSEEVVGIKAAIMLTMHTFLQKPGDSNVHVSGTTPRTLLAKYEDYQVICVGDHHAHFSAERNGRVVVNPGALTIQNVELKDAPMGVFLVEIDEQGAKATSVPFPADTAELVDDAYIELDKARAGRLEEFSQKMAGVESSAGTTLDFEARVLTRVQELTSHNQMEASVATKIFEYIGHGATKE